MHNNLINFEAARAARSGIVHYKSPAMGSGLNEINHNLARCIDGVIRTIRTVVAALREKSDQFGYKNIRSYLRQAKLDQSVHNRTDPALEAIAQFDVGLPARDFATFLQWWFSALDELKQNASFCRTSSNDQQFMDSLESLLDELESEILNFSSRTGVELPLHGARFAQKHDWV